MSCAHAALQNTNLPSPDYAYVSLCLTDESRLIIEEAAKQFSSNEQCEFYSGKREFRTRITLIESAQTNGFGAKVGSYVKGEDDDDEERSTVTLSNFFSPCLSNNSLADSLANIISNTAINIAAGLHSTNALLTIRLYFEMPLNYSVREWHVDVMDYPTSDTRYVVAYTLIGTPTVMCDLNESARNQFIDLYMNRGKKTYPQYDCLEETFAPIGYSTIFTTFSNRSAVHSRSVDSGFRLFVFVAPNISIPNY
jgi:hypothetical protein